MAAAGGGLLIICALLAWPTVLGGNTAYVTTHGSSMAPTFRDGDLAIVRSTTGYQVGDIVAYRSRLLDTIVLHRIIHKNGRTYVLKGDNNTWTDRDHPTQDELIGKLRIRIPRAGQIFTWANDHVQVLAALAGFLLVLGLSARKRDTRHHVPPTMKPPRGAPAARSVRHAAIALVVVGGVFAVAAVALFIRPTTTRELQPVPYHHTGSFTYGATVQRDVAYSDGQVQTGDPIFVGLVQKLDIGFTYRLDAPGTEGVHGTIAFRADVADARGWVHSIELQAATEFQGVKATARGTLDLIAIEALLTQVQALTGTRNGAYTVTLSPRVHVEATLDGHQITSDFAPHEPFSLDSEQLVLQDRSAGAMRSSEEESVQRPIVTPAALTVWTISVRTEDARVVALALAILCLATGAVLWVAWLRRRPKTEADRIALRCSPRLLPALSASGDHSPIVDLATIEDLVRVSEHSDAFVVHRTMPHGEVYLCVAAGTTYRYIAATTTVASLAHA